jgi:hypothetical protein
MFKSSVRGNEGWPEDSDRPDDVASGENNPIVRRTPAGRRTTATGRSPGSRVNADARRLPSRLPKKVISG